MKIDGGAIIWARQTIDSEIFYNKPDKWFKIWFYLVAKANHTDNKRFKEGSCFLKYDWIMNATGANKNEVDHCIRWLKSATMIATQKATRGFTVNVLKYPDFQNLKNYKSDTKSDAIGEVKAKQKRNKSDTINKNVKNGKNDKNNTTDQKEKIYFDLKLKIWVNILSEDFDMWESAYPSCNIEIELKQMGQWLLSNPDKRKKNYRRFVTNWLARSQERGGTKGLANSEKVPEATPKTEEEIIAYQKEKSGWSAKEQIMEAEGRQKEEQK